MERLVGGSSGRSQMFWTTENLHRHTNVIITLRVVFPPLPPTDEQGVMFPTASVRVYQRRFSMVIWSFGHLTVKSNRQLGHVSRNESGPIGGD